MPTYKKPKEVTLHRGLQNVSPHELDVNDLGVHWTQEPHIAKSFSQTGKPPGYDSVETPGIVLTGTVSTKHTPEYDTPAWNKMAEEYKVMHPTSEERETPVLPHSPMHNLSAIQFENGKITRGRFFGEGNTGTRGHNG